MGIKEVKRYYEIFDGPSRDRIFDACKYAYDEDHIRLDFKVAICYNSSINDPFRVALPMYVTDVRITKVEHKDSSGLKLNLAGNCKADLNPGGAVTALNYREYDINLITISIVTKLTREWKI